MKKPKPKRQARRRMQSSAMVPDDIGLSAELYAAALHYLFDRPVPKRQEEDWYWDIDQPDFEATPLEWTRIQTVLFANAGKDLEPYDDDQVGMGLNYIMSNGVSNVPFAAIDRSVPIEEAMRMMQAMPALWRQCIGPRMADVHVPIGAAGGGRLGFVCYMWFDVWPTFWRAKELPLWRDALWQVFREMLDVPCREVQISALHGIGHHTNYLDRHAVDETINAFVRRLGSTDGELNTYAEAARQGMVQ